MAAPAETPAPVALVTGVSSGIGSATAAALAGAGYRVFGTVRRADAVLPPGVERVVLDVRDAASIAAGVRSVHERGGRIDLLVNNAGGTIVGAVEETSAEQAQALFDVNFFGAFRVTQEVLPIMRAQRGGRVLFISSVVGFLPAPYMGFYAASKHALEGLAESLDHEVRNFGVRVSLIEPGFTKSNIDRNSTVAARPIAEYDATRERAAASIRGQVDAGDQPEVVAAAVVRAAAARRPRMRYPVGKRAGVLAKLRSFMPASMFDGAFRKSFGLDAG